jgi:hypothetical protein
MRWKISAVLDLIFSSLAAVTACALGNVLVEIHFAPTLRPHSNVVAHLMFRALIAPTSLAEALIPPYWLPPIWWPLLIGLLGLAVAEIILILLSTSFIYRAAVLAIAKSQKIDINSAYQQAQEIPNLAMKFKPILVRRVMLALPVKMSIVFVLGGIAGVIAWLISIFTDYFSNGVLQVFLACLVIAIGGFIFDLIDEAKKIALGADEELDIFSELAEIPPERRQRKSAQPKAPRPLQAGRASPGRPQRLLVTAGGLAGTTIALTDQQITIGRANDATLVLNDKYASHRHARLIPHDGQWIVDDLGSTNGTYLDRQKVTQPTPVPPGVPIRIGGTVLELRR